MVTMLDLARILASVSVILLVTAFVAWLNPFGRPQRPRLNVVPAANVSHPQTAAALLLAAVGLSAVAAVLAIAGWFAS